MGVATRPSLVLVQLTLHSERQLLVLFWDSYLYFLQTKRQQDGRTPGRTHFRIISSGFLNLGGLDAQLDQFAHPYCPQSPHLWVWTLQRWILSQMCRRDQPFPGWPQWRHVLHHVYIWS